MQKSGFTTGCLYKLNMPLEKCIEFYSSIRANAIELSFSTVQALMNFELSRELSENIKKYGFISIHAPWINFTYDFNSETNNAIKKLSEIQERLPINGIVFHPDTATNLDILANSSLPVLIENMDSRKKLRTTPEYFEELKRKYNFGFVLDIQHAYEHDSEMNLANELIKVMGNKLNHLHVSGCTDSQIHFPVHLSKNKDKISRILKKNLPVPKILEGILLEDIHNTASNELQFIKAYEKSNF